MIRAFEIAGYTAADVEARFGGMLNAFRYGAPPHGGSAPGIDRIVMLLADEPNIREVILFPLNQQGEDLMMGAPAEIPPARLKELSLRLDILPPQSRKSRVAESGAGRARRGATRASCAYCLAAPVRGRLCSGVRSCAFPPSLGGAASDCRLSPISRPPRPTRADPAARPGAAGRAQGAVYADAGLRRRVAM